MTKAVAVPDMSMAQMRVFLGPRNIVGQAALLAQGLRAAGIRAEAVEYYQPLGAIQWKADRELHIRPGSRLPSDRIRQTIFAIAALRRYNIFHFFWGDSLMPARRDLWLVSRLARRVVVHFRGSDVRDRAHIEAGWSDNGSRSNARQRRMIDEWRRIGAVLMVSTPDLLREVPDAQWVPQAINLRGWPEVPLPCIQGGVTRIAHPTTSRSVKGTGVVIQAIEELRRRGYALELDVIEGVPPSEMSARMAKCHIGIDQVSQGNYGNVSIQFMALGRPVINYLDDAYDRIGIQPPVVTVKRPGDVAALVGALIQLLEYPGRMTARVKAGREYVCRVHDVNVIVSRLVDCYAGHGLPGEGVE